MSLLSNATERRAEEEEKVIKTRGAIEPLLFSIAFTSHLSTSLLPPRCFESTQLESMRSPTSLS